MAHIRFDYTNALSFFHERELKQMEPMVSTAHRLIHEGKGVGNDFLGWVQLPVNYDREEFSRILKAAEKLKRILMSFWSSESAVPILAQERQWKCCTPVSTTR
jgi:glucose-6-phosphate isomerase (EC 5.3.1.9)